MKNTLIIGLAILMAIGNATPLAQAQEQQQEPQQPQQEPQQPQQEPQASEAQPTVARISFMRGDVSMQRGDSGDWVAATVNTPVMAGDHIATGPGSQAELQLDFANIVRLGDSTQAGIADLTPNHVQVQVGQGIVNYSIYNGTQSDVEIDTPNVTIHPLGEGSYRIVVTSADESQVIARKGQVDVSTSEGSTRVNQGELITIRGRDNAEYQTASAPASDDFDQWVNERDHQILTAQSSRYTNRYYTGTSDLDNNGRWAYVPDYGEVWQPSVPPDWAPYRDGRWTWEPYYGWTWVSYEPWGWAPYHYGRWFYYGDSWSWWPGPVYANYYPVWAPAYVNFFGFGGGVGFGFGFGSIGWLPIGPCDYFFPWWGFGGFGGVSVVNITNITNITNIRNITNGHHVVPPLSNGKQAFGSNMHGVFDHNPIQRGITTMPADKFGKAAVRRDFQRVTAADLRQGRAMTGMLPVVPTRESLRPSDHAVKPSALPRRNQSQRFVTKSQPTFKPQPFEAQAARVRAAIQRQPVQSASPAGRPEAPGTPAGRGTAPNTSARGPAGSTQRGAPIAASKPTGPASPSTSSATPGWRRFSGDRNPATPQSPGSSRPQKPTPPSRAQAPVRNNPQPPSNSPAWGNFSKQGPRTPQSISPQRSPARDASRSTAPAAAQTRSAGQRPGQAAPTDRPSWQRFSTTQPGTRPMTPAARPAGPASSRGYSAPPASRGPSSASSRPPSSSRPPLDLRKPVVGSRPPSGPSSPRPPAGGGGSRPPAGYSSPRPPAGGGGSRPPAGYGSPRPPAGGGGSRPPSGYGAPAPGGGSHGAPSGGSPGGGSRGGSPPSGHGNGGRH